jgi:hypothetical protein
MWIYLPISHCVDAALRLNPLDDLNQYPHSRVATANTQHTSTGFELESDFEHSTHSKVYPAMYTQFLPLLLSSKLAHLGNLSVNENVVIDHHILLPRNQAIDPNTGAYKTTIIS